MSAFLSHARNSEDVILWRALGTISSDGRYVEVAASRQGSHQGSRPGSHPGRQTQSQTNSQTSRYSTTRAFDDRGWTGTTITPVLHGSDLRLDEVLTESGWTEPTIHFMLIDVEGIEGTGEDVLKSLELGRWRPWVLVVKSTRPSSPVSEDRDWEPGLLAQGYQFCLFDGISRFYVAAEQADPLSEALSYPACVRDDYQRVSDTIALREREELLEQATHWRMLALTQWAAAVSESVARPSKNAGQKAELEDVRRQLAAMQHTLSWRVTRPIRGIRRVIDKARR